jgi:uncharacterized protein Veg
MIIIEQIKSEIKRLYETNPNIHISVNRTHPKVIVDASPAKIVGVYKNIFQVEECEGDKMPTRHSFQYGDVLIGQVKIDELDYGSTVSILNKK